VRPTRSVLFCVPVCVFLLDCVESCELSCMFLSVLVCMLWFFRAVCIELRVCVCTCVRCTPSHDLMVSFLLLWCCSRCWVDDDQIILPPLSNFVMNRVLGDYLESLLYKIFVSIDERTTIQQLATVLQLDREVVKTAVSLLCRYASGRVLSSSSSPPPSSSIR
jgi:FAM91 N-terminus